MQLTEKTKEHLTLSTQHILAQNHVELAQNHVEFGEFDSNTI